MYFHIFQFLQVFLIRSFHPKSEHLIAAIRSLMKRKLIQEKKKKKPERIKKRKFLSRGLLHFHLAAYFTRILSEWMLAIVLNPKKFQFNVHSFYYFFSFPLLSFSLSLNLLLFLQREKSFSFCNMKFFLFISEHFYTNSSFLLALAASCTLLLL